MKKSAHKKKKKGTRKRTDVSPSPKAKASGEAGSGRPPMEAKAKALQPVARREPEKRAERKANILGYLNVATQFLREAKMELKKVKWPTRKELLASTAMVIFLVLIVSLFLGVIDFGLIKIIKNIVG
jgi:preprotein translocase subunit SecE